MIAQDEAIKLALIAQNPDPSINNMQGKRFLAVLSRGSNLLWFSGTSLSTSVESTAPNGSCSANFEYCSSASKTDLSIFFPSFVPSA